MGNPTRFMVSWDDHSTHLVARLGHLLERQQLVDVTLMCNTHSLKVHRSVLAACSPYFERELGNHPMIVLKDMKFSVLKSLIEFMYCGETNVTEDNLHALVEAAKFFEVKGLSSLVHESLQDSKAIKPPSFVGSTTTQTRICQVSSSPIPVTPIMSKVENGNYSSPVSVIARLGQNNTTNERRPCAGRGRPKAHLQSPCCEPLVSKPAPITPPQTESAQILLSLAGSNQSYISPSKHKTNDNSMIVSHQEIPMSNGLDNNNPKFNDDLDQKYKRSRKRPADSADENNYDIKKSMPNDINTDEDVNRSPLLASLLTKNDKLDEKPKLPKPHEIQTQSSERYINALKGAGLPTDIPILIENGDGNYITLTENVYDILAKEDALHFQLTDNMNLANLKQPEEMVVNNMQEISLSNVSTIENNIEDPILKNIKNHSPPDNPDDVVVYKVADDGNIEKFVLTSEDIKAFKESMISNPERKKDSPLLSVSEINVPLENKSSPLITKILDCGNEKFSEALLGRLPLRKRGTFKLNNTSSDTDMLQQINNVCAQSSSVGNADTDVEYVVVGEDSVQMDLLSSGSSSNKNNTLKNNNNLKLDEVAEEEMSVLEAMMNNTIEFSAEDGDYQMHNSEEVFSNDQNDNEKMILSNVLMCTGAENSNSHVGLEHFGFKSDDVDRNGDCNQQKKSKMYGDLDLTGSDFISEPVNEEVVLASELNPSS